MSRSNTPIKHIANLYRGLDFDAQKRFNDQFLIGAAPAKEGSGYEKEPLKRYLATALEAAHSQFGCSDTPRKSHPKIDGNEDKRERGIHGVEHAILTSVYAKMFADFYKKYDLATDDETKDENINWAMIITAAHDIARVDGGKDADEYKNAFYLALILEKDFGVARDQAIEIASHVAQKDSDSEDKSFLSKMAHDADCAAITRITGHRNNFNFELLDATKAINKLPTDQQAAATAELRQLIHFISTVEMKVDYRSDRNGAGGVGDVDAIIAELSGTPGKGVFRGRTPVKDSRGNFVAPDARQQQALLAQFQRALQEISTLQLPKSFVAGSVGRKAPVPPVPAPVPAPPPPPPPPLAPPPLPPATKKPLAIIKKSDFERGIDAFNAVTDSSWLTHQNVDKLLHDAFVASGIVEDRVNEMTRAGSIDTCAIDNGSSDMDHILRDAVLKFIGQDPRKESASIALCSGGHLDPVTGHVSGGSHWTALHLKRVTNPANDLTTIEAFTMNSSGNMEVPAAVGRVLRSIRANHNDIMSILDEDARSNAAFIRAARVLRAGDAELKDAVPRQCDVQKDRYSCGYHAVFNLVRMQRDPMATLVQIRQDGHSVGAEQFIGDSKAKLMRIFPAPSQRVVPKTTSDPSRVAPAQDPENEVTSIVFDDELSYVAKLEKLIAIEERLVALGDVLALSNLQIEKYYGKILNEVAETFHSHAIVTPAEGDGSGLSATDLEKIISRLADPKISQNPKIILESLKEFFSKLVPGRDDFLKLLSSIDSQLSEGSEEQKWQGRCAKLYKFLQDNKKKFPESFAAIHEDEYLQTEEAFRMKSQELQSTISLEQRKQKIFKDLDLVDLDNAKDKKEYRELVIEGTHYLLERDDKGVILLWQNPIDDKIDNFSKVDQAKIDHVLHKIESEITSKKIVRMKDGDDKFVEGADGSLIFVVKTLIDLNKIEKKSSESSWGRYSPNQIAEGKAARISEENARAEGDGERWEGIGENNGKIEMAKFVTLPKDDTMWKLEGEKIKLVGELGTGKHTKLDSEIMKYYLEDHVGKNVEETKKIYGVTSTSSKPSPIISKLISAKALHRASQRGVSA